MIIEENFHSIEDFQRVCHRNLETYFLYFYADWCKPCGEQLSLLNALTEKYPDLKIYSLNIDKHMFLVDCFQIKGIPYILGMKGLKITKTFQGLPECKMIEDFYEKSLTKD